MDIPVTEIFGPFEGAEFSREIADEIAIAKIPYKERSEEAGLYQSKWFDYRRLHPTIATYLFVREYGNAFSATMVKAFDCERGPYRKGLSSKDGGWIEKKERTSLWRLRQTADRHGMPYEFFLRRLFTYYLEQVRWSRLPRPQHLLGDEAVAYAAGQWQLSCRQERIPLPLDPFFSAEQFEGHPDQVRCERWLIEQAERRSMPRYALASLVHIYKRVRSDALTREQLESIADLIAGPADFTHS